MFQFNLDLLHTVGQKLVDRLLGLGSRQSGDQISKSLYRISTGVRSGVVVNEAEDKVKERV